jgi:hypothetical protein
MRFATTSFIAAVMTLIFASATAAIAAPPLPVYPGAKPAHASPGTRMYTTSAPMEKVEDWYESHLPGSTEQSHNATLGQFTVGKQRIMIQPAGGKTTISYSSV